MKKAEIALTALFLFMLAGCEDMWNHCVDGNGNRTYETRELDTFGLIQVNGDFEVRVDTGPVSSAVVEADENLLNYIVTHISGDKLIIESRNGSCLRPAHPIEITVTTPHVRSLEMNGSGYLYCFGLQADELLVRLSGSGRVECYQLQASSVDYELEGSGNINSYVMTENLAALLEGSGEIRLNGTAVNSDLRLIGSGRIKAGDLNTDACVAYISGSGTVETDVNHALDVTIIGSGNVYYSGDPVVETYISGSGKVIKE